MNRAEGRAGGIFRLLFAVVLLAASCAPRAHGQDQSAPAQPQEDRNRTDKSVRPTPDPPPPDQPTQTQPTPDQNKPAPSEEKPEVKITPREAEDLFHSVDEILDFDSKQTGLPIKKEVKRKLTSRDEVVSYLTQHLDDEDTKRLRRSELVLKKFGLLPRDFDLQTFLVALLREEIAGYYDPKTRTVNLLEWVPMEEQEPVMAHELTHALQDQSVGLEKWMKKGDKDLGEMKKDPTPADIENDEIDDAREAVIEGQAQAIMFQYAMAPTGRSITTAPDLVDQMEEETLSGTSGTKVFNDAPIFMKESLTFPYSFGMEFIIQLIDKGGKEKAFAGVLRNPPHTTRQIMQPETYLSGEKIDPIRVPDFKHDFKEYQKFDIGAMGEFDVSILIEQYAGKPAAKRLYPEWRGGYYYAAKPKSASKSESAPPLGLLYVSRWSSADKAAEFAAIYARSLTQRYKKAAELGDLESEESLQSSDPKVNPLKGRHAWTTEDGPVVIKQQGDTVFVSESLDAATTAILEREVFADSPIAK
jgi:hypothetical protein